MKKILEISKPFITNDEIMAVVKVLKSRNFSQGPRVKELEEMFATYCGTKYAVAMINGTATLHSALYALGVQEDDEVITSPFTFVATGNSILMQKAKPVFCDVTQDTGNIDANEIEKKINKKTKVILPVDLYGHMYDVEKINSIAEKYKLKILEDAAQSVGAEYKKKKAGSVSDIASFSLYATKNITAGLGGILTTNDKSLMEKCKLFRHHGQKENSTYEYIDFGYNYRMMDIIAVIGIEQLKKISYFIERRRKNAQLLSESLIGIKGLVLPVEKPKHVHGFHQYTIRITKDYPISRDELLEYLHKNGIMARIYYPKPLHLFPHFRKIGYKEGDFPVAERLAKEVISLPIHPLITEKNISYIIKTIRHINSYI